MKQYLKGEAREAVEALFYFDTETGYSHARQMLEERYGNPYLFVESSKPAVRREYVKYTDGDTHPVFMEITRHYILRHRQAVRTLHPVVEVSWEKMRKSQYLRYCTSGIWDKGECML